MTFQQNWFKWIWDIFAGFVAKDFNNCGEKGVFPDDLKHADFTWIHKKWWNQLQVCMLTNISKIYEKLTYNQYSFVYYINIIVYNIILIILQ